VSDTTANESRAVARAIDALRRGWPVAIGSGAARRLLLAVETTDRHRLAAFDPDGSAGVLISHQRAVTLHLANQLPAAADAPVRIARVPWLDLDAATALADPAHDLDTPLKGPYRTIVDGAIDEQRAAITLARLAGLLPAFFIRDDGAAEVEITRAAVDGYEEPARLRIAAHARLPVDAAEHAEIVAFRNLDEAAEHVALLIGSPNGTPPLVRLHSECLTGDVLGSLKCDCGPQLHAALAALAASSWGILLYLRQEGRGIGLINKLRAYALQDQGFDTIDANTRLGFATDARDFAVAARMLALLGQDRVRLLTNNPEKVAGLVRAGIEVVERVPHALPANPHNRDYLDTKRVRAGHLL